MDDLGVVALLRAGDAVDGCTLVGVRGTPEGVLCDDGGYDAVERADVSDGSGKLPDGTLGVGGLNKVCHGIAFSCQPWPRGCMTDNTKYDYK